MWVFPHMELPHGDPRAPQSHRDPQGTQDPDPLNTPWPPRTFSIPGAGVHGTPDVYMHKYWGRSGYRYLPQIPSTHVTPGNPGNNKGWFGCPWHSQGPPYPVYPE